MVAERQSPKLWGAARPPSHKLLAKKTPIAKKSEITSTRSSKSKKAETSRSKSKKDDVDSKRTLFLTLKKGPFDAMVSGEKQIEVRSPGTYIEGRLYHKPPFTKGLLTPEMRSTFKRKKYDFVRFQNGYQSDSDIFTCEFKGFEFRKKLAKRRYSNGLEVSGRDVYVLRLGKVVSKQINRKKAKVLTSRSKKKANVRKRKELNFELKGLASRSKLSRRK
jgi:hypothetical protein